MMTIMEDDEEISKDVKEDEHCCLSARGTILSKWYEGKSNFCLKIEKLKSILTSRVLV